MIKLGGEIIPVVLFAYRRPIHLGRVLKCLKENQVPLIYAFADGARGDEDKHSVEETRGMLRNVDWSEVHLVERPTNIGLGRNVLAGVSEISSRHETFIVWEDDLICVPGTYSWMCAALRNYSNVAGVMSVSAWTHPRVVPPGLGDQPYLDGRAECWVWGTWKRAWKGMLEQSASTKLKECLQVGVPEDAYGADLPAMAAIEQQRNIWAVRWLYHHLQHAGLCVRPPWSLAEHIGFDAGATNAAGATEWANPPLRAAPSLPLNWPEPVENPHCRSLWQKAYPHVPVMLRLFRKILRYLRKMRK